MNGTANQVIPGVDADADTFNKDKFFFPEIGHDCNRDKCAIPHLLSYVQTAENLSTLGGSMLSPSLIELWGAFQPAREKMVQVAERLVNFGIIDRPQGRAAAYANILGLWGETDNQIRGWGSGTCEQEESSCGLVVRSIWRLAGMRHPLLAAPYAGADWHRPENVLNAIPAIGREFSAYYEVNTFDEFYTLVPLPGDVIFARAGNEIGHVFTLVNVDKGDGNLVLFSVDGGQFGPRNWSTAKDANGAMCCGIHRRRRVLNNSLSYIEESTGKQRTIKWIIRLYDLIRNPSKLNSGKAFSANVIELQVTPGQDEMDNERRVFQKV